MGGIWHSKEWWDSGLIKQCPGRGNCGPETFITTPTCPGREALCSVLFYIPQNLKTSAQPHGKLLQTPIFYLKFFQICLSPASQIPQHVWAPRFLDSVLAHSLVSVTYLAPRLAIWSRNYTLTLAFMLVQSKVWFLGFLSGIKCFAPRTPGPISHLTNIATHLLPILRPWKGHPIVTKITYRILSLSFCWKSPLSFLPMYNVSFCSFQLEVPRKKTICHSHLCNTIFAEHSGIRNNCP